jgi:cytochrome c5
MKKVLILFVSLTFTVLPVMVVQADESQTRSKQDVTEQAAAEKASPDRSAEGKSLYEGRCAQMCHQLPEPGMLKLRQWKYMLVVMQQRMQQAGLPPLTEQETELILGYLAERAHK